jgi:hypothetical protein
MKSNILILPSLIAAISALPAQDITPVQPEAIQKWQDARFGMFIHWGPGSLKGTDPYGKERSAGTDDIGKLYNLLTDLENHIIKAAVENKVESKKFHEMADNFLGYMMKNFETELTVMGARIALTTYDLPFLPTKLKNFDEFHQRFGKYILQASA